MILSKRCFLLFLGGLVVSDAFTTTLPSTKILSGVTKPNIRGEGIMFPSSVDTTATRKNFLGPLSMAADTSTEEQEAASADAGDDAAALPEVESMRVAAIKAELESYGISTKSFLEKSELVEALKGARAKGMTPQSAPKKKKKRRSESVSEPSAAAADEDDDDESEIDAEVTDDRPRDVRLAEERVKCEAMKASELKKELQGLGISTVSFFEKSEFVKALAEARVDGVKKAASSSSKQEGYAEYADVEVITDDSAGPRSSSKSQQQPQSGSGSPFGGGANPFGAGAGMGGMGGMGGMADILKNMGGMGGMGGAAGGANPFGGGMPGGMGGMGDMMGKAQEMMKNPKVMEIMMKAQSNPKIMKAMQECMGNPAAFAKYQNDPEVGELMNELKKYM